MSQILKVVFVFAMFSIVNAVVKIDIEPEELQSMGELLVESYFTHNLIQRKPTIGRFALTKLMKLLGSTFKMCALTASLVASNLISAVLQPKFVQQTDEYENITSTIESTFKPTELCPGDFGCDGNLCWKHCEIGKNESNADSWCFTTPKPEEHQFQYCKHSHDCSPCWDCIGICNSNKK